jgi:hypothetical protein
VEGRECCVPRDDGSKMIVSHVQPLKNVEDEVVVGDGAVEVDKGVGHTLHLAIVAAH